MGRMAKGEKGETCFRRLGIPLEGFRLELNCETWGGAGGGGAYRRCLEEDDELSREEVRVCRMFFFAFIGRYDLHDHECNHEHEVKHTPPSCLLLEQ